MSHQGNWFSKALVAVACATSATAALADRPDPSEIYVNNISTIGSGCPKLPSGGDTVAVDISEDRQSFTLAFSDYIAEAGPGVDRSLSRRSCNINLNLHIPGGWQYSVFTVDYRGFVNLDSGVSSDLRTNYRFQGGGNGVSLASTMRGPSARDYTVSHRLGIESIVWSPCGGGKSLTINSAVSVMAGGSRRGLMTVDTIDGTFKQVYGIQWQRCRR